MSLVYSRRKARGSWSTGIKEKVSEVGGGQIKKKIGVCKSGKEFGFIRNLKEGFKQANYI